MVDAEPLGGYVAKTSPNFWTRIAFLVASALMSAAFLVRMSHVPMVPALNLRSYLGFGAYGFA